MTIPPSSRNDGPIERRQLTVLFCDLVSSTALAERLSPEDLHEVLRSYQETCGSIIRQYQGHVAQYLGDGVLAYFGYPVAHEASAKHAVEAGLELARSVPKVPLSRRGGTEGLQARVGIHTGPVAVGEMGDSDQRSRLAVGETPHLAARIQALAGAGTVLVSESTNGLVAEYFDWEPLGSRNLKGSSRPLALFRAVRRSGVSTAIEASRARGLSAFCGRKAELESLVGRFERAAAGAPGAPRGALVVGDPGVGKSRLVHETLAVLREELVPGVLLGCTPDQQNHPFLPLLKHIERWAMFGALDDAERRTAKLAAKLASVGLEASLADLTALLTLSSGGPLPEGLRARAASVLTTLLRTLSGREQSVVVLEDAHWADPSTLEWARSVLDPKAPPGVFLIVTSRMPLDALGLGPSEAVEVRPLSSADADQLADECLARLEVSANGAPVSRKVVELALERAAGVPLFIEEMLAALVGRPERGREGGRTGDEVPAALQDALMARLDRVGPAKALAQLAATIGREVPFTWLQAVSPVTEEALRAELQVLVDARLMEQRLDEDIYAFRHVLIRDLAYQSLSRGVREEFHQRIAECLSTRFPALALQQPELLAHHYGAAALPQPAVEHYVRAGQRALATSAFGEAIDCYKSGLNVLLAMGPSTERDRTEIDILSSLGIALISSRGFSSSEVEETFSRARALCERHGEVPLKVLYGVYSVHLVRADARALARLAPQLQRVLTADTDETVRLVATNALGVRDFFRAEYASARTHFRAASALIDPKGVKEQHARLVATYGFEALLTSMSWLAWCEAFAGRLGECARLMREVEALAEGSGDPYLICQTAAYMSTLARDLRDREEAARLGERALALASQHGFHFWLAFGLATRGWTLLSQAPSEGMGSIKQGLAILDGIGSLVNYSYFQSYLVDAYRALGDVSGALHTVDTGIAAGRESIGPNYEPELLRMKGELLAEAGDADAARDFLEGAVAMARLQGVRLVELRAAVSLGEFLVRAGRPHEAREVVESSRRRWAADEAGADTRAADELLATLRVSGAESVTRTVAVS